MERALGYEAGPYASVRAERVGLGVNERSDENTGGDRERGRRTVERRSVRSLARW